MSTTQRRKAVSSRGDSPPRTTTAEPPLSSSSAAAAAAAALPSTQPAPAAVATVRRRKWGTSAFDENWLNRDCCGLFCALLTYGLHVYGCHVICFVLLPPWMSYTGIDGVRHMTLWGHFHRLAFCMVAVLAILSHFKAMTTDPGAVPPDAKPLPDPEELAEEGSAPPLGGVIGEAAAMNAGDETTNKNGATTTTTTTTTRGATTTTTTTTKVHLAPRGRRLCRRCNAFKPERAHHCSVCKRCIIKMDHHCPWVNNCVGIGNHKYFLLFIFYTCVSCVYSLALVVSRFVVCLNARHGNVVVSAAAAAHRHHRMVRFHCLDEPTHLLNIIGLLVEAALFGMFTSCMMADQWDVVMTNMTHIDRLKGDNKLRSSVVTERVPGVMEVFGMGQKGGGRVVGPSSRRFRSDWLSPFAKVSFPSTVRDEIFGYCRPCNGGGGGGGGRDEEATALLELAPNSGRMVRSVAEIV